MSKLKYILSLFAVLCCSVIRLSAQLDVKIDVFDDFYDMSSSNHKKIDSLITVNSSNTIIDRLQRLPSVYSYISEYNTFEYSIRGISNKRTNVFLDNVVLNSPYNGTIPNELLGLGLFDVMYIDYSSSNKKSFSNTGSEINLILPETENKFALQALISGGNSNGFGLLNTGGKLGEFYWNAGLIFNARPDYPLSKDSLRDRYTLNNSTASTNGAILDFGFENKYSRLGFLMALSNSKRNLPVDSYSEYFGKIPNDNRLFSKLSYETYLLDNIYLEGNIYFNTENKSLNFYYDKEMQFLVKELFGIRNIKSYSYGIETDYIIFNTVLPPVYVSLNYRKDITDVRNKIDSEKDKNETERLQFNAKQSYLIKNSISFIYSLGFLINNPMRIATKRTPGKTNHVTYDFGIQFDLKQNLSLSASLGRGVRIPYINEYESVFSDSIQVLLALEPEEKQYYEVGVRYQPEYFSIGANYFANSFKNYIFPLYKSLFQTVYVNNGEVNLQGIEFEFDYEHKYFGISSSYSMIIESQDMTKEYKETIESFVPKDMFKSTLTILPLSYVGLSYSFDYFSNYNNLSSIMLHHAAAEISIIKNMKGKITVKNLFDKSIPGINNLPLLGREISIGAYIYI